MNILLQNFELLIDALNSLPGIGKKMATRLACFFLDQDEDYIHHFCQRLISAQERIFKCRKCNNYTEDSLICSICSDNTRNQNKICVVTSYLDLINVENSLSWNGIYYILEKELSINKNVKPEDLDLKKLTSLINENTVEVILSTNLTAEGIMTADYVFNYIKKYHPNTKVYRIGLGMPLNSSIDYADERTLKFAFENKQEYKK